MIKETTVTPLVEMFNVCPVSDKQVDNQRDLIVEGLKKGYLISPQCINSFAKSFIDGITMKYNSTFFQTWDDVTNKDRLEIFINQVVHYFTAGGYIPNTNQDEPEWKSYKVIESCTFEDLYNRCMGMLVSGIALKSDVVKYLTDYVVEYCQENCITPDVDSIKNREAMVILADELGVYPKDGAKLFSLIVYKATGLTMIVKNKETRRAIRENRGKVDDLFYKLNESQLITLVGVYNRYKELFIAFKTQFNRSVINKIGHLSKKHHKPMVRGFWETILSNKPCLSQLKKCRDEASKTTNYKLIQVMQSVRERFLLATQEGDIMYVIRNGKVFIKDNDYLILDYRYEYWERVYNICMKQLVKNLSKKACTVKFPTNYTLVCPTSEKNFIGNIPMGTSCELGKDSVVGIYWENDWGTNDFDLSYNDVMGGRIGWAGDFYDEKKSIMFSGDITYAPHGANEVIRFNGNDVPNGIVYVNRYSGNPNSKYRLFFGTADENEYANMVFTEGYCMVDPNRISLEAEIYQGEMRQQMIGLIFDGKFVFYSLSSGYGQIVNAVRKKNGSMSDIDALTKILHRKSKVFIPLKDVLLAAGFKESDKDFDIDLTQLNRDTLIDLFS